MHSVPWRRTLPAVGKVQRRCRSKAVGVMETSETTSQYGDFKAQFAARMHWTERNSMDRGGNWRIRIDHSWLYPRAVRGKGFEYRKFMGVEQFVTPHFVGGPTQAVHDENRNKVFHRQWDFPGDLRESRWPDEHIRTRTRPNYYINHFSKPALKVLADNAMQLTTGRLMHNPYHPGRPVRGPVEVPVEEMEIYRRQAFLAGIEFPQFPDVQPVQQTDPWEQGGDPVPLIPNDKLLDKEMWAEINQNMINMEQKVKAFKDTERKKLWAWKMSLLMQQLKRARQEEAFMAKQATRMKDKRQVQQTVKPWERAKLRAQQAKKDEDVSEEFETEEVTTEYRKEMARHKRESAGHRPPGSKL